jgi:hypothetical protein
MSNKKQTAVIQGSTYTISIDGTLRNTKTNKVRTWVKSKNGYMRTQIWVNNKPLNISQHRVMAHYFINNPENKLQVNHINGIKHDNRIENLEWVTQSENAIHSFKNGLQLPTRPHMKKIIDTKTGNIYDSITDCANAIGLNRSYLNCMLRGKLPNNTTLQYHTQTFQTNE